MTTNKGFAPIAILILIVGAILVVVKVNEYTINNSPAYPISTTSTAPTPNLTSDWTTFTNDEYGYSFKYYPKARWEDLKRKVDLTQETTQIFGPDNLIFRVELAALTSMSPLEWWNTQTVESYTGIKKECFIDREITQVMSWDNKPVVVKTFSQIILLLELKPECQEPKKTFRTLLLSHRGRMLRVLLDYGEGADAVLSTFKLLDY